MYDKDYEFSTNNFFLQKYNLIIITNIYTYLNVIQM